MADETGDEVQDKFAKRFDNDSGAARDPPTKDGFHDPPERDGAHDPPRQDGADDGPTNIKKEWTNHSVYLDDGLTADLRTAYKRLDLDLDDEYGRSLSKTRDYYPLIVALGLERLESLDLKEVKDALDGEERTDE